MEGGVLSSLPQPFLPLDNKNQERYFKSWLKIDSSKALSPSLSSVDKAEKQRPKEKERQ